MIHMQILWLRIIAFGRHLGPDDRIEVEVKRDDRRTRLIPFAAMVAVGVVATYFWLRATSPEGYTRARIALRPLQPSLSSPACPINMIHRGGLP